MSTIELSLSRRLCVRSVVFVVLAYTCVAFKYSKYEGGNTAHVTLLLHDCIRLPVGSFYQGAGVCDTVT